MFELTESIAHGVDLTPINAVRSWADKSKTYNYQNPAYTEFTQMIWKGTEKVGCAWVNCPTGTFDKNKVRTLSPTFVLRSDLRMPYRSIK